MEYGKAQILLGLLGDGLSTFEQVLQTATDEDPKDFELIVDVETRISEVMRTQGRVEEADEILRRLVAVSDVLTEEDEDSE